MKFSEWVTQNQSRWVGFRQLQEQIAQAVGADFDVQASVVDIRFDRQGNSKERRYLFLTHGAVLEVHVAMHTGTDFGQPELTATLRWLPLEWIASMGHAITISANQTRPDARYTVKFQQESGLGPLLLPPMEQEDLQADELAEYLAFGRALSRKLLATS